MRYDDMLATVLAQPQRDAAARLRVWRQIVDLLAQGRHGADEATIAHAYAIARAIRPEVPLAIRASAAKACSAARVPAALIAFFSEEVPEIAGPLLSAATLDADEWLAILPLLSPFAKGQLRARDALPEALAYALGVALDPQESGNQISDLLSRIEAYRQRGPAEPPTETPRVPSVAAAPRPIPIPIPIPTQRPTTPAIAAAAPVAVTMDRFRFTIAEDGMLIPREPAPSGIGRISVAGSDSTDGYAAGHGVDGHAAGAWRRRLPFSEARLIVGGDGAAAGPWRISAEPCFAAPDGRFVGYAGEATRPRIEQPAAAETVAPVAEPPVVRTDDAQRIERLFAALRHPLDLIGLAASGPALAIPATAGPTPAMPEADEIGASDDRLDAAAMLGRLHAAHQGEMASRGVRLSFRVASALPPIAADPGAVERMFARLLAATLGIARRGECVVARLGLDRRDGSLLSLSLSRPGALMGLDDRVLLGPALEAVGDFPDAPRLALSFAIRLVRNLAEEAGGALDILPDRFVLTLPLANIRHGAERHG